LQLQQKLKLSPQKHSFLSEAMTARLVEVFDDLDVGDDDVAFNLDSCGSSVAYRKLLGKWARLACEDLGSSSFWLRLYIAHVSRGPIMHCMNFLMDRSRGSRNNTLELIFEKSIEIVYKFDNLLISSDPVWHDFHGVLASCETPEERSEWVCILVSTVLEIACEYSRRIHRPLQTYPFKLAWLVCRPAHEKCEKRQAIADELMAMAVDAEELHDGCTNKFRVLFEN
jgi:hypothetical protein